MKGTKPEERQPLKLEVCTSSATAAVLAVEKGALELSNLEFRLPDVFARIPPVLLKVDGNLRLNRCRLITSEKQALSEFKTLIEFHGSGEEAPDRPTHACVLNQTILLSHKSGPTCVRVVGSGARLWFQKTLLVAAGDGISFNLGESFKGRANIQCWFLDSTLAARRSAVVLQDSATALVPDEPIFVRSRDCAIVNPFPGNHKSGLLRSQDGAFGRGLLLWQSEGDALDKRLHYVFSAASLAQSDQRQVQSEWEKLWGSQAVQRLFPDADWPKQSLDGERWGMTLDRLEVPPIKTPGTKDRTVGVKMSDLGIKKKGP